LVTRSSQGEARSSARGDKGMNRGGSEIKKAEIKKAGNKAGRAVSSLRLAKRGHGANKMLQITKTIADMTFAQKQITLSHGSRRIEATSESGLTKSCGNGNGKL
jgi:hypothetical protein